MADEVEIGNVGSGGVASDATLERLIKAVESLGASRNMNPEDLKRSKKELKQLGEESKNSNKEVKDFGDEIAETTTIVEDFGGVVSKAGSGLLGLAGSALGGLYDSVTGLTGEMINGGNRFSDFTKHIPLVGGVLTSVVSYFEDGVDAFRTLSENGASFGNSLIELKSAAANANMPLDMFVSTISENAESMLFLGGTITQGAKRFGALSESLRNSQEDFLGMGFTMEGLNEHTAGYLKLQARLGRLQGMSQQQLAQGAGDYLKELDRLAKVTGMSRKEAEKLMQEQAQEANVAAIQSRLSGDALKNFQSGLAFVENQMPGLSGAFKDLADGVAQTDVGQKIAALSPGLAKLFGEVGKGAVPLEELQKRLKENLPELTKLRDGLGGAAVSALMGEAGFGELFQSIYQADEFLGKTFDPKAAEEEQKKRDKATSTLASFEQVIANVRSAFTTAFINSGVLELIGRQIGDAGTAFAEVAEGMAGSIKEILESDKFKSIVKDFGIILENLKKNFSAMLSDIISFNFSDALSKLFSGTGMSTGGSGESSSSGSGSGLSSIFGGGDSGSSDSGMFGGLMNLLGISWTDIALAIGGVTLAVAALGKIVTLAIPGFAAMGAAFAAVGLAAVGIGAAFAGASLLVSELGDAISGVVESISNLMTAQKAATTEQIQQLTQIDDQAMHDAAAGITAMKEALDGFGPGMLDSIGGAIGGLLGDDMGDQVNYMKQIASVGPELSVAGEGMAAISSAAKQLDDSNIRAYTEAVEELVEAMKELNGELSKDNNGMFSAGTGTNAGSILGGTSGGMSGDGTSDKLDQLNTLMAQVLQVLQQGTRYTRDTTRAIKGQGDLMQGF